MKVIDCHLHMQHKMVDLDAFLRKLDEAGVEAVGAFSFPPQAFGEKQADGCPVTSAERIAQVRKAMTYSDRIHGMYWIDPTEPDAIDQVNRAVDAGICGFKVICTHFYPDDERAMRVYEHIAQMGKPMHFHSGVLYSPHASSKYNRPLNFEPLLEIPHFRFAMAHIAWPWVDEYISVFGHWASMREQGYISSEMFIDTTPGTPAVYREDALTKLYSFIPEVKDHIMIGIDNHWDYNVDYCRTTVERDRGIFEKIGVSQEQQELYFYKNYLRFIGQ